MEFLGLALLVVLIGLAPLLLGIAFNSETRGGKAIAALVIGIVATLLLWWIFYASLPSLYEPWWGMLTGAIFILWVVSAIVDGVGNENVSFVTAFPVVLALVLLGSFFFRSTEMMNADAYANLMPKAEKRVWTQDIQPKDPRHIRMASVENALYRAQQAVANGGTIGSQFVIDEARITLQIINKQMYFVVPLDFQGWGTWRNTHTVPAYIRVSAEDSNVPAEFVKGQEFRYTPGAWFGSDLMRYLWTHGYANTGLTDITPEVDENGKFYYIVTSFEYGVNDWDGKKVTGAVRVDPTSGDIVRWRMNEIPSWVDRVVPADIVKKQLSYRGTYIHGFQNAQGWMGLNIGVAKLDLTEPEEPVMVYSSDGDPNWVVGITSKSNKDTSLVGLYYVDSRTNKWVFYEVDGGSTDSALIAAMNKHPDLPNRKLHATTPQIYNIAGTMAAVMPLLNDNHAVMGTGIVNVKNNSLMAWGENQVTAYESYQTTLSKSGHQIAPELRRNREKLSGAVDRFFPENGMFYFHVAGVPHIFKGASILSSKLRLTKPGDQVVGTYYATGEEVEPLDTFDNLSLPLQGTQAQAEVAAAGRQGVEKVQIKDEAGTIRENLKTMSDEELVRQQQSKKK